MKSLSLVRTMAFFTRAASNISTSSASRNPRQLAEKQGTSNVSLIQVESPGGR